MEFKLKFQIEARMRQIRLEEKLHTVNRLSSFGVKVDYFTELKINCNGGIIIAQ